MKDKLNFFKVFLSCQLILLQVSSAWSRGQTRIVGGSPTNINSAPFLVQVLLDGDCICGGTLVAENFVVTAAHCVENIAAERVMIVGGASKLSDTGVRSKVSKIMIPKSYNNKTANNDVAVIKTKTPIKGTAIREIGLCEHSCEVDDPVQIYGWGLNSEDDEYGPNQMHTVTVKVISKNICQKMYLRRRTISNSMFCATAQGKDSCSGDSGGPAIIKGKLCGIVSWGVGCGQDNSPGAYTDMMKVYSFVESAMQQ